MIRVPLRVQLIVGFALLSGAGFALLAYELMSDMRPRYLEAMEDGLVDDARLFAALLERNLETSPRGEGSRDAPGEARLDVSGLDMVFRNARARPFEARINGVRKTEMSLRLYVTDANGIVRFDSENRDVGKDFSRWNDVYLTLRGQYGARSTREDAADEGSSVKYVAAPILHEGRVAGVVTVGKPSRAVNVFLREARAEIATAGIAAAILVALVGWMLSSWVTRPVRRLTAFARAVRDGREAGPPPAVGRSELRELGLAFGEMREALEGRKYVESYVQSLAHALKSPLASVQGAAELLQEEDLPPEMRARFLENVRVECGRMDRLVGRMLELASLESRRALEAVQPLDAAAWIEEGVAEFLPLAEQRGLTLAWEIAPAAGAIEGDAFLLRQALGSLIENALEFSPPGGGVRVTARGAEGKSGEADALVVTVEDAGPGIPEFALERVFEKFFSLPRPGSGRKSTGLGLSWVKEVTRLHEGALALANAPGGGLRVTWTLPRRRVPQA